MPVSVAGSLQRRPPRANTTSLQSTRQSIHMHVHLSSCQLSTHFEHYIMTHSLLLLVCQVSGHPSPACTTTTTTSCCSF